MKAIAARLQFPPFPAAYLSLFASNIVRHTGCTPCQLATSVCCAGQLPILAHLEHCTRTQTPQTKAALVSAPSPTACLACFITSNSPILSINTRPIGDPDASFHPAKTSATNARHLPPPASPASSTRRFQKLQVPMECCMSQNQCLSSPLSLHQTNLAA